jgi:hypothetical protein
MAKANPRVRESSMRGQIFLHNDIMNISQIASEEKGCRQKNLASLSTQTASKVSGDSSWV